MSMWLIVGQDLMYIYQMSDTCENFVALFFLRSVSIYIYNLRHEWCYVQRPHACGHFTPYPFSFSFFLLNSFYFLIIKVKLKLKSKN